MRLVDNRLDEETLAVHLAAWSGSATEASIQVAYLRVSGLRLLDEPLRALVDRGVRLRVLTCGDFAQTEPEALRFLRDIGGHCDLPPKAVPVAMLD